jgi:hypothetical protein
MRIARSERAVQVVPGATLDRRADSGLGLVASSFISSKAPSVEKLGMKPTAQLSRVSPAITGAVVGAAASRPVNATTNALKAQKGVPSEGPRQRRSGDLQPPFSIASQFSALYELEHHRGALEILLLLNVEDSATASIFRRRLRPGPAALAGALQSLLGLGLIESHPVPVFPFGRIYGLTQRGRLLLDAPLRRWTQLMSA